MDMIQDPRSFSLPFVEQFFAPSNIGGQTSWSRSLIHGPVALSADVAVVNLEKFLPYLLRELLAGPSSRKTELQFIAEIRAFETAVRIVMADGNNHQRVLPRECVLYDLFSITPFANIRYWHAPFSPTEANRMFSTDHEPRKKMKPTVVRTMEEFRSNFIHLTDGLLQHDFPWHNVVVAGGAVSMALLQRGPGARDDPSWYRDEASGASSSDIDMFFYGLRDSAEAHEKLLEVYFHFVRIHGRRNVLCVRQEHTVTIYLSGGTRPLQLILRLYTSVSEILYGFDIDCCCVLFDGVNVSTSPRGIFSFMTQTIYVDNSRRSPSYEVRLGKYAGRGFEIFVPGLKREQLNLAKLYDPLLVRFPTGLSLLVVLERLVMQPDFYHILTFGRPRFRMHNQTPGFSRPPRGLEHSVLPSCAPANNYDGQYLRIPWESCLTIGRIVSLLEGATNSANQSIFTEDYEEFGAPLKPHRHPAFWGTMLQCIEGQCSGRGASCSILGPVPDIEMLAEQVQAIPGEFFNGCVDGRISFITSNPGGQVLSGSFNPIDAAGWSDGAYVTPLRENLEPDIPCGEAEELRRSRSSVPFPSDDLVWVVDGHIEENGTTGRFFLGAALAAAVCSLCGFCVYALVVLIRFLLSIAF